MKVKFKKEIFIFIAFFFITLSWSKFFIYNGLQNYLEYTGLFFILFGIYVRHFGKKDIKKIILLIIVMFFFSIGLILQNMDVSKKVNAIISMFILASIAIIPCKYINKFDTYLGIEKAIISGLVLSTILSFIFRINIITGASEGIIVKWGFDAGLEHRNYLSYVLLSLFLIEYMKLKLGETKSKYALFAVFLFILSTNSRSSFIILFLFLVTSNINKIRVLKHKKMVTLFLVCVFLVLAGVPALQIMRNKSETFHFRFNGLYNYLHMFSDNMKYMLFGNLKIAYGNSNMSYDENIRSIIGWDGSTELVIFNVLIKNGLIGFIGYFLIFRNYVKTSLKLHNEKLKIIAFAIIICFIISSFVESYVANINHLFTVFIYLLLANISKIDANIGKGNEISL